MLLGIHVKTMMNDFIDDVFKTYILKNPFLYKLSLSATVVSPSESYEEGFLSPPHVISHKDGERHMRPRRLSLPTLDNMNVNNETNKVNEEEIIEDEQPVHEKELHENELKAYQGTNKQMHKSLGQGGMSSIMNKVVQESKANLGRRGSWSGNITPSRYKAGRETLQALGTPPQQSREIVHVLPLVCSPSYSAVKLYPEFIFSPSDKPMERFISHPQIPALETVTEQESKTIETQKESEKDIVPTVNKSTENNKDIESVKEDFPVSIHTVVVREHYPVHPKTMFIRPASPPSDTQIQTQQETPDTSLIVASQKKEEPKVLPKPDVDLGEKKEENPKTLKAKENSEMNLLDSLTSILDSKFSTYGVSSDTPNLEDTAEQLISPQRRKSLISEACLQVRKKRSSSSPAENALTKPALSTSRHQSKQSDSTSVLISPTRRQQLIDAASEQIFELRRRKSFSDLPRKRSLINPPKIDESVLLPKSHEKPHDMSTTNTSLSSSKSDDRCDDKNGFTNGTAGHDEPQTTCVAEQFSHPRSKSLLKRHKSDRSVRTRLFPFLSRKGGSKHKTTNDLNDPRAGDVTPPLSGSLTAFHRSRSTHFRHRTKELS